MWERWLGRKTVVRSHRLGTGRPDRAVNRRGCCVLFSHLYAFPSSASLYTIVHLYCPYLFFNLIFKVLSIALSTSKWHPNSNYLFTPLLSRSKKINTRKKKECMAGTGFPKKKEEAVFPKMGCFSFCHNWRISSTTLCRPSHHLWSSFWLDHVIMWYDNSKLVVTLTTIRTTISFSPS